LLAYPFYGTGYPVVARFHSFPTYYGAEFTANAVRNWLEELGVATLYIEPGSPWENGYVESFIGKLRDELLNGEVLDTLMEAKVLVEGWRKGYNRFRPHSSLGYRPPVPEAHVVGEFTLGLAQC
jgi:putative transposase